MKPDVLALVLLVLAGATACNSGSAPSNPDATPAGCERTLCDLRHDGCQNPPVADPCSECFQQCSAAIYDNPDCAAECQSLCDEQHDQPAPPDPCGDALTACRQSSDNTLCVDDLGDPAPDGTPCNDTASRVACACSVENDSSCDNAVYAANPACQQCDAGWMTACENGTCIDEKAVVTACFMEKGCASSDCAACANAVSGWQTCITNAEEDPSDPAGCYSGPRGCWTLPQCNPDGTSSP